MEEVLVEWCQVGVLSLLTRERLERVQVARRSSATSEEWGALGSQAGEWRLKLPWRKARLVTVGSVLRRALMALSLVLGVL